MRESLSELIRSLGPHEIAAPRSVLPRLVGPRRGRVHAVLPTLLSQRWMQGIERAGITPIRVVMPNGDPWDGDIDASETFRATPSFLYRAAVGRRSRAQIDACFIQGPPSEAHVDLLCIFGPSKDDLTH